MKNLESDKIQRIGGRRHVSVNAPNKVGIGKRPEGTQMPKLGNKIGGLPEEERNP
jgi:hypothetical protein